MNHIPLYTALLTAVWLLGSPPEGQTAEAESATPPAVRSVSATELQTQIRSLKGKVVLINLWATWCGPCRKEMPSLVELQKEYGSSGLQIVGLSIDDGPISSVAKFAAQNKVNYPVYVVDTEAATAWGEFEAIPMTFLLDRNGKKVWEHEGYASKEEFEKQLKPLLSK